MHCWRRETRSRGPNAWHCSADCSRLAFPTCPRSSSVSATRSRRCPMRRSGRTSTASCRLPEVRGPKQTAQRRTAVACDTCDRAGLPRWDTRRAMAVEGGGVSGEHTRVRRAVRSAPAPADARAVARDEQLGPDVGIVSPATVAQLVGQQPAGTSRSIVSRLQLASGNQALQGLLQRVASAAIQRDKVAHTTGKQVDTYLNASPFIKSYVADKVKNGTKAEGHVHIEDAATFAKSWETYAPHPANPNTGAVFTKTEAAAWEPNVNAFRDGSEIHIHEERGETGTAIHEYIHLFADGNFRDNMGFNVNEGATEFLARAICAEQKITRGSFYVDELRSVEKLVALTSKEELAAAYFNGKIAELKAAVNAKKKDAFDKWLGFMKTKKYADADKLL